MTVKIFHTNNKKVEELKAHFKSKSIPFTTQNLEEEPLEWEQFLEMVQLAENGVFSILPHRASRKAKALLESIDFDEITLREFHNLVVINPYVIRSLLTMSDKYLMVGYSEEELSIFDSRKEKKSRFDKVLNEVRLKEKYELEEELGYAI